MATMRRLSALALLVLPAPAFAAQNAVEPARLTPPDTDTVLMIRPESRLWIEGTSTVRDYRCDATRVDGAVELDPAQPSIAVADLQRSVRGVRLDIAVADLDCRNGTMNDHMRKALKAEDHPAIAYRLTAHQIEVQENGDGLATLEGELTIAGTMQPVTIAAVVTPGPDGTLKVQGSKEIVMTEFGVSPPKLMLGALKVNPRVVVSFDIVLKR
ncbi:MAG TPA: YceI family protein [Longimicrobiales bacterium]